jgi:hypothetical protein
MSATNRGSIRSAYDRYETPDYTIKSLLDNHEIKPGKILECSCGNGNIQRLLPYKSIGIDIDGNVGPNITGDYLQLECKGYNTIISNPPYNMAMEFLKKALDDINIDGEVIFLLRLNFLGSKKRSAFFKEHPPSKIYILSKRPSFNNKGTDATEYAWFVWNKIKLDNNVHMEWV